MGYYSDLLSEIIARHKIESNIELFSENIRYKHSMSRERYKIETKEQEKVFDKKIGTYDLISIPDSIFLDGDEIKHCVDIIVNSLRELLGDISFESRVLVVGLGNRHISSDSLGTKVCSKVNITMGIDGYPSVMSICPSVLGLTGIETYDIISGVISKVKPTHLILIDSLCASSVDRLGKSIQLSNTGLCPGSGVGNKRKCIGRNLCGNIVSIGVPLLIYASTFLTGSFEARGIDLLSIRDIMQNMKNTPDNTIIMEFITKINDMYGEDFSDLVVSPKDVEEMVEVLSDIISMGINKTLGVLELKD